MKKAVQSPLGVGSDMFGPLGFLFVLVLAGVPVHADDHAALVQFYRYMDGPGWKYNTNWLSGTPCENAWYGVECTNGRVTGLYLTGNRLKGVFPDAFGDLDQLVSFDLSENQITGVLPATIKKLTHLMAVGLRKNKLSGAIPELPAAVAFLHLDFNSFDGALIPELAKMTGLAVLGLTNNRISGELPEYLGRFPNLGTLLLGGNAFTGPIPTSLQYLKKLSVLDLSNNKLTGVLPNIFDNMLSLTELDLFGNALEGDFPAGLQRCAGLVVLDMHANRFSGVLPPWLPSAFPSLLYLSGNQFHGFIPTAFEPTRRVPPSVDLSGNPFTCPIPYWASYTRATCQKSPAGEAPKALPAPARSAHGNDDRVKVEYYGEAKCPDMASLSEQFVQVQEAVGSIMDLTIGYIAEPLATYPTGFWHFSPLPSTLLHTAADHTGPPSHPRQPHAQGQSEAIGDMFELCALNKYPLAAALQYMHCLNQNQSRIPLPSDECAQALGLNATDLQTCAFEHGPALLTASAKQASAAGAVWSPTLYIAGKRSCLWDLFPCETPQGAPDIIKAICKQYQGAQPLPDACNL
ncbi:putative leucine rich repeat protein [Paratrimastix pyriformis]|uniref:Leucine rich repeat protein n=1 Tax=Paratrimastix pyriformis TaxID=342808 RepID=A0ABQ8UG23_9EUKA|nr:putative leucine rich repeat protein [Paratrimastix pyriformis]